MFLLAAIYFLVVAALGEGSTYTIAGTVVCLLAILAGVSNTSVSGPWRVASASFSLVLFVVQLGANFSSITVFDLTTIASTLINGAFFILFLGVLLTTTRTMLRKSTDEEEEETPKESKKLTYEI